MPPWMVFAPRYTFACRRTAIEPSARVLYRHNASNLRPLNLRARSASTHVSPTAINFRPNIPPENKELHEALSGLGAAAEQYVSLSRLQLALSGLGVNGSRAVTRVAVLGLNSQVGAQKLARLLVADPLGVEGQWERELEKVGETDASAVLLRFGDEPDAHPPSPLYKVLSVPSRVLNMHNLEILVSTLNVNLASTITSATTESSRDSVLVPKLQAISARGQPVPYPVHKTLILGEGLDSAIAFGKFTADSTKDAGDMVKVAIDLPPPSKEIETAQEGVSTPVNIDAGMEALSALRKSVQNATIFEKNWFASNLPTLSKWLVRNIQSTASGPLKPAHRALISSLLDEIETNITRADTQQLNLLASSTAMTQKQVATEMIQNLEAWAEKGHEELRDSLDEAFHNKSWSRLKWWKLWWRVDDVGMMLEEALERRWLLKTEKNAVYLAGRMKQAGFAEDVTQIPPTSDPVSEPTPDLPNPETDLTTDVKLQVPWPSLITTARAALLSSTLPPLQALAQRLILSTVSTTSISSALSALLYVSVSSFSVFEASAIAALGVTISLRRMQQVWENAREHWARNVREEGRQTLKAVESDVRVIIRGKKNPVEQMEGVEERKVAREAVANVREALEKMER
ncbi:hypothetical protein P280DRAFT_494923 [Massarina eburnea CBS 473.64]|uniref:Mmc1 C-terminal domain-containing protein n=1 Tax=Massarina eburnea CBS 473.64 TaxID=1395130 RepID=A0A6A6SGB3_9PLEO|nr:hypothetical protein P280DRAFT_494923 [Massarina eburnea CBS 473.64]